MNKIDEKTAGMIALTIISIAALYRLGAGASTVVGTAIGAIGGFITGTTTLKNGQ